MKDHTPMMTDKKRNKIAPNIHKKLWTKSIVEAALVQEDGKDLVTRLIKIEFKL